MTNAFFSPSHVFSIGAATTMIVGPKKRMLLTESTAVLLDEQGLPLLYGNEAGVSTAHSVDTQRYPIMHGGNLQDIQKLSYLVKHWKRHIVTSLWRRIFPLSCIIVESVATHQTDRELMRTVFLQEGIFPVFIPGVLGVADSLSPRQAGRLACIVDIGASHTQFALVDSGALIASRSVPYAGRYLDQLIQLSLLKHSGIICSLRECERAKLAFSAGTPMLLRGKDRASAQILSRSLAEAQMQEMVAIFYRELGYALKTFIAELSPSLTTQVQEAGITVVGAMSQLPLLSRTLFDIVNVPVQSAARPTHSAALGVYSFVHRGESRAQD